MPSKVSAATPTPPALGTLLDNGSLELVEVLGYGGYGVVYRAIDPRSCDLTSYAVKCLIHSPQHSSSRQRQIHLKEITLHQRASDHPGVVTLHRVIEDRDYTYIVMEYCGDGDLFSQILNNRRYLGRERLIKHVFLQLLDAVEYCHTQGIYHRDLKPENVLCFDDGLRLAITDFGLATTDKVSEEFRTGSVYHMSPECRGGIFAPTGSYSPMFNDIWSLGIILLNIITGRNPWRSASETDPTFRAYMQDPLNFLPTVLPISSEVNDLLARALEVDWRKRITLADFRRAMKSIHSFYSPDVIFQGSMARCPWEADIDLEEDSPSSPEEEADMRDMQCMEEKYVSHWSQDADSDMVFATQSEAESPWTECATVATWGDESAFVRSASPSPAPSRRGVRAPRTPPSTHSMSSPVASIPSLPPTPRGVDAVFTDSFDDASSKPALTINTACLHPDYDSDVGSMLSPGSSAMQTAMESANPWSTSLFFFESAFVSPTKESGAVSTTVDFGMDVMSDDEDDGEDAWAYSTSEEGDIPSIATAPRSSVTGLDLNFDDELISPEATENHYSPVFSRHPPRQSDIHDLSFLPEIIVAPPPPPSKTISETKSRGAGLFNPIKSSFLRSLSPNSLSTFQTPRTHQLSSFGSIPDFLPSLPPSSRPPSPPQTRATNFILSPMATSPISPKVDTRVISSTGRRDRERLHKRKHWFSLSPGKLLLASCVS